jgi:2-polyprenyl-3-methyl-5-hydroxy-6-metoxy-1,4-benzoquinol methylase
VTAPGARVYELVRRCDNCDGTHLAVYGAALDDPDIVHPLQVLCRTCGLVFATPRLSAAALADVYRRYELWSSSVIDAGEEEQRRVRARALLEEIRRIVQTGRLLDVGSGTGSILVEARAAGYDVAGIEPAAHGVAFARDRYGLESLQEGTLESVALGDESYDVVVAWHVIEHVFDLDAFVTKLRRALVPGGLLVIGTESYAHPANTVVRAVRHLSGRVPRIATHSLHTFVFSPRSLRDCLERRGFETRTLHAYDERTFAVALRAVHARRPLRRSTALVAVGAAELAARASRRGPYLRGFWIRNR